MTSNTEVVWMQIQALVLGALLIVSSGCVPHATGPPLAQIEGPQPGKVVVYLYLSDYTPSGLRIYINDTFITQLVKHSYYRYVTNPGVLTINGGKDPRPQDQVIARVKAGAILFIKYRVIKKPFGFDLNLISVDEETALHELSGLRLVVPSDWAVSHSFLSSSVPTDQDQRIAV